MRLMRGRITAAWLPWFAMESTRAAARTDPATDTTPRRDPAHIAYLLLVVTTLFWAFNFIAAKWVKDDIGPFALAFWRWATALLLFAPFAWRSVVTEWPAIRRHWKSLLVMGAFSSGANSAFAYLSVQHTSIVNISLLNSMTPVFILLLAVLMVGEKLTALRALGAAVSTAGALVIAARAEWSTLASLTLNRGDFYMLSSCFVWAIYTSMLKRDRSGLSPTALLAAMMVGGVCILALMYSYESAFTVYGTRGVALSWKLVATILYVGLFASLLSNRFWMKAVTLIGPARAGFFTHLLPLFGVLLAIALLGEPFHAYHLTGAVLIFGGIILVNR